MFIVIPGAMAVSLIVLSLFIGLYYARCWMEMLTQSSTGLDRVSWPTDWPQDWIGTAWLLLLVLGGLGSLTAMVAAPLALVVPEPWQKFSIVVAGAIFVWAGFPILLCALHHPRILGLLPRRPGAVLRVFGMTAPLTLAAGGGMVMLARDNPAGAYVIILFAPLAVLIHARAWGRLVWLVLNERPCRRKTRRRDPETEFEPETTSAIRAAEPTAAPRPAGADDTYYSLEATDFEPEQSHLAEHYETMRERERWKKLRAREEETDPLGRTKSPRPWTALAPSKIFGVIVQEGTATVYVLMATVLGLAFLLFAMMNMIFFTNVIQ